MPKKTETLPIDDIPLPPEDPDFDGIEPVPSQDGKDARVAEEAQSASPTARASKLPIDELDFVDCEFPVITLAFPYRRNGKLIKSHTVHPLTLGEVQDFSRKARDEDGIELVEIYAAMTRISVAELRGLKSVDGDAIVEAARDFLPRAFRGASASG